MPDRTMRKIFFLSMLICFIAIGCIFLDSLVYGADGSINSPYEAKNYAALKAALTAHSKQNGFIYIAITGDIKMTDSINVTEGKYRIFSKNANRSISRSVSKTDNINKPSGPKYCFNISGYANVTMGYDKGYSIRCDGMKNSTKSFKTNGFFKVEGNAELIIDRMCSVEDVRNNVESGEAGAILNKAGVVIKGIIYRCDGISGGGVKMNGGFLTLEGDGCIMACTSQNEGGGIHANKGGVVNMLGGSVEKCSSNEEGGGIFVSDQGTLYIKGGIIRNNYAGGSGGGVFSGLGSTTTIGDNNGNGPKIIKNHSAVSGGGIRCNGGSDGTAGGYTTITGGSFEENHAEKYGGGISVGDSEKYRSHIEIKNIKLIKNTTDNFGAGIFFNEKTIGIDGDIVKLTNCQFIENNAKSGGGALFCQNLVITDNCTMNNNKGENGGAVFINSKGSYTTKTDTVDGNSATKYGNGVYVAGKYLIKAIGNINKNDVIYLCNNCYIDIPVKLSGQSFIATIDSANKNNGTVLVKVSGDTKLGHTYLYNSNESGSGEYKDEHIFKRFEYYNKGDRRTLRSGNNVSNISNDAIILSEKYRIKYFENTLIEVENMPDDQIKFWNESTKISSITPKRKYYDIDYSKHWNTVKNGMGSRYVSNQTISENKDVNLYAIWKLNYDEIDFTITLGRVRFISINYLDTLFDKSIWKNEKKEELNISLSKKSGEGIYSLEISDENRKKLKGVLEKNNYRIDDKINNMIVGEMK